jgi:hypothetical protein
VSVDGVGRGRLGGALADDLTEDGIGAGLVLGIGGMFFIPGVGDKPAKVVIMFCLQDKGEEFFLFLRSTAFLHVTAKQVGQSL